MMLAGNYVTLVCFLNPTQQPNRKNFGDAFRLDKRTELSLSGGNRSRPLHVFEQKYRSVLLKPGREQDRNS